MKSLYITAEIAKNLRGCLNIRESGTIEKHILALCQNRSRNNRQGAVFCTLNINFTAELFPSRNKKS